VSELTVSRVLKGGVKAIDTQRIHTPRALPGRFAMLAASGTLALAACAVAIFGAVAVASAAGASTGKLAFYPCTRCHPVAVDAAGRPLRPLPNGFKKHEITLEAHDILGNGEAACLACHQSPQSNPGKLLVADGSTVDVNGDVSRVCQRCHFEKYRDWKAGIHGKHADRCTSAGCHDPHTPSWIYVAGLPPFQGTGMEVKAVGAGREPFRAFAPPPIAPPVYTPAWLAVIAALGAVVSLGAVAYVVRGRSHR
jgi:hypothetical protein